MWIFGESVVKKVNLDDKSKNVDYKCYCIILIYNEVTTDIFEILKFVCKVDLLMYQRFLQGIQ